jgi:hypothetical protein
MQPNPYESPRFYTHHGPQSGQYRSALLDAIVNLVKVVCAIAAILGAILYLAWVTGVFPPDL